jgi:predicted DNA-binding transcriptional regulator AlpA
MPADHVGPVQITRLLTTKDVSHLIGMSQWWIRREAKAGNLPGKNFGTEKKPSWRFLPDEIEQWIRERT